MKRCPEWGHDYLDDTLNYYLSDGTELVHGISPDVPVTANLSEPPGLAGGQSGSDNPTRPIGRTTAEAEPLKSLGDRSENQSFSANRAAKPLLTVLAVTVVAVIGFCIYKFATRRDLAALCSSR